MLLTTYGTQMKLAPKQGEAVGDVSLLKEGMQAMFTTSFLMNKSGLAC